MVDRITTDRGVIAAKPRLDGTRRDYAVEASPGLQLRVTVGAKKWSLIYRRPSDGKQVRLPLGEYPAVSLSDAKKAASEARTAISRGSDPGAARRDQNVLTFEKLALRWLEHAKKSRKSWPDAERNILVDVVPALGAMKAEAITKRDVIACCDAIVDRGAPVHANRIQSLIGSIFAWAISEDILDKNPTAGLHKRTVETPRERTLTHEEIRRFWGVLDGAKMHSVTIDILRLCLLTGQRVNEVAQAAKSEFDLTAGMWTIPGGRVKNGRSHRLPITGAVQEIIQRAFDRSPHSSLAFPTPAKRGIDAPMGNKSASRAWRRSRDACGLDTTVHDLRRTFSTLAGDQGFDDFDIDLVTNHFSSRSKIGSVYNRSKYDNKKRQVLEAVERRLLEIIENREPAANVVPLRKA